MNSVVYEVIFFFVTLSNTKLHYLIILFLHTCFCVRNSMCLDSRCVPTCFLIKHSYESINDDGKNEFFKNSKRTISNEKLLGSNTLIPTKKCNKTKFVEKTPIKYTSHDNHGK